MTLLANPSEVSASDSTEVTRLAISKIRTDGGTQPRAEVSPATVAEYAEAMREGANFPAVKLVYDGSNYWLADGFHRLVAAEQAGLTEIAAEVVQGTQRDAVLISLGANAQHGLRRTNADKRRAVEVMLRDEEWGRLSDREIARRTAISNQFVSNLRKELGLVSLSTVDSENGSGAGRVYIDRYGNTAVMNTANIGTTKAVAAEPAPEQPQDSYPLPATAAPATTASEEITEERDPDGCLTVPAVMLKVGSYTSFGSPAYNDFPKNECLACPNHARAVYNDGRKSLPLCLDPSKFTEKVRAHNLKLAEEKEQRKKELAQIELTKLQELVLLVMAHFPSHTYHAGLHYSDIALQLKGQLNCSERLNRQPTTSELVKVLEELRDKELARPFPFNAPTMMNNFVITELGRERAQISSFAGLGDVELPDLSPKPESQPAQADGVKLKSDEYHKARYDGPPYGPERRGQYEAARAAQLAKIAQEEEVKKAMAQAVAANPEEGNNDWLILQMVRKHPDQTLESLLPHVNQASYSYFGHRYSESGLFNRLERLIEGGYVLLRGEEYSLTEKGLDTLTGPKALEMPTAVEALSQPAAIINQQSQAMQLLTSSARDDWGTPEIYIEAARLVLGWIDLDPASNPQANEIVKATRFFTKEDNGLALPWGKPYGRPTRLFGNFPYGGTQALFVKKLVEEFEAGRVQEAIILVNLYYGYDWFAPLRNRPMCLVDHRIAFRHPDTGEEGDEAKASSVFVYFGKDPAKFYRVFSQFGYCCKPEKWN